MAARRTSSSSSRISSMTASTTRGPPILPSASAARVRTHQSSSLMTCSSCLMSRAVPRWFSTSTAARRAYSFSSFSTSMRYFIVSGSLARTTTSIARFATSRSGSRSSWGPDRLRCGPSILDSALSAAWRISLFGSRSCVWIAADTSGRLKRDRMLMMCMRAIESLPSMRLVSSGIDASSASSPMMRNSAAFSFASWLYACCSRSRTEKRCFWAAMMSSTAGLETSSRAEQFDQQVGAVVVARGQRPAHRCDRARAAVGQALRPASGRSCCRPAASGSRRTRPLPSCPRRRARRGSWGSRRDRSSRASGTPSAIPDAADRQFRGSPRSAAQLSDPKRNSSSDLGPFRWRRTATG